MFVKFNNQNYFNRKIFLNKLKTLSYHGKKVFFLENKIKKKISAKKIFLTKSATAALEAAAYLIDIKPGDEIITSTFNYYSTVNAFALRGAKIIFTDINLDDLNISYKELKKKLSKKTKAIILTHYAGKSCDLIKIKKLAYKNKIILIEDAAHAYGSKLNKKFLGTFGDMGIFSFHETKNISCGDGGALIINKKKYIQKADFFLSKGTNKLQMEKGLVKKYEWKSLGSNSKMSELNAIILNDQIKHENYILNSRKENFKRYYLFFKQNKNEKIYLYSNLNHFSKHNFHIFYVIFKSKKIKSKFIQFMKKKNIECFFHYSSLGKSNFFLKKNKKIKYPCAEFVSDRLVRLPMNITITQQEFVLKNINYFLKNI